MEVGELPDALIDGLIDATWAYCDSGVYPPSWLSELELRVDLKVVPLTNEEVETIGKHTAGIAAMQIPFEGVSERIEGPEDIWVMAVGEPFVFSSPFPEEAMYLVMTALYEKRHDFTIACVAHRPFEMDPYGSQVAVLDVACANGIPLHPGFAKWLKEGDVWNDDWIVGKLYPK
jgi:TRAP-type uncharacterized transport system substrate-binding protein